MGEKNLSLTVDIGSAFSIFVGSDEQTIIEGRSAMQEQMDDEKPKYGARVYGMRGRLLVKQTVLRGIPPEYVIDEQKERHVSENDDSAIARAIRDAVAGNLDPQEKQTLNSLLAKITEENQHGEVGTGKAAGRENW